MRKRVLFLFLFVYLNSIMMLHASGEQVKSIRVAYIQDHGYYTTEENGGLTGYNYDYLMMVSQHTGWNYEFVEIIGDTYEDAWEKAVSMLQNGDIDLLGNVFLTEETEGLFQFPAHNTGISRENLVSLANNYKITLDNFFLKDILRVALVEGAEINQVFFTTAIGQNPNNHIIYVNSDEDALAMLIKEEVDAIVTTDTSRESWMLNYLTTIDQSPFYFVSTKGNTEIIDQLDQSILKIEVEEPNLHQRLLTEYFATLHQGSIILTTEEEEALADYEFLTIGLLKGREPYQFFSDDVTSQGISVDILEEISLIIGQEFRYVWVDSEEELKEKIANREIDIFATMPFDSEYELNHYFDVVITQPYLTNAVVWLHQGNEKINAVPYYYFIAENIPFFPDEELVEITNFETALLQLSEYGEISIFTDPYLAQYHIQKLGITNIEMQTITSVQSKVCFGVGKHLDSAVVGLLNHALLHLDTYILDEIIYENVTAHSGMTLQEFLREHTFEIILVVCFLFLSVALFLILNAKKFKKLSQQDSLTKLLNAGFFHSYAEKTVKKVEHGGLILLDIDYFKEVNDNHGHQAGDAIIVLVGETLKRHFRHSDKIARLGGDEFVILIENSCDKEDLEHRLSNILSDLSNPENKVPITLSIGAFLFHSTIEYSDLYHKADKELYKVKENGRNNYSVFCKND